MNEYEFLVVEFLAHYLNSFKTVLENTSEDPKTIMRQIGKQMSKEIKIPEFKIKKSIDLNKEKPAALEQIADIGLNFLKVFNIIGKTREIPQVITAKKVDFIKDGKDLAISLKVELTPFDLLDNGLFYYLGAGFF